MAVLVTGTAALTAASAQVLDQLENVDFCLGLFIRFMAANLFVDVLAGGSPDDEMLAEAKSALGLSASGGGLPWDRTLVWHMTKVCNVRAIDENLQSA